MRCRYYNHICFSCCIIYIPFSSWEMAGLDQEMPMKGNWEVGLEMEWEEDELLDGMYHSITSNDIHLNSSFISSTSENGHSHPFGELLEHTWTNKDVSGLERPSRLEVPIAVGWKEIDSDIGPFYFHGASRTCTWTRPYTLPENISIVSHIPPLGVFSRKRPGKENENITEENENDGLKKHASWKIEKKEGVHEFTPCDKTAMSFLHEFCVKVLRCPPDFILSFKEDPKNPFCTTVMIKGKEYGSGCFSNKKKSKQLAAENALELLCPGVFPVNETLSTYDVKKKKREAVAENKDDLMIDDERVLLLGNLDKTPAQLLQEYCNREGIAVEWDDESLNAKIDKFRVHAIVQGERVCYGDGRTKKEAKQRTAQQFLKLLHPNVHSWVELLKLFSSNQSGDSRQGPSNQLLITLKEEMRKAIESQSYFVIDDHPDAYLDASESNRLSDDDAEEEIDMDLSM